MKAITRKIKKLILGKAPSPFDGLDQNSKAAIEPLIQSIRNSHITLVGITKLKNLAWAAVELRKQNIQGTFLEAGVALGGTAVLLAKLKPPKANLLLYDVFGLIPPPSDKDDKDAHDRFDEIASGRASGLGGQVYYGYRGDLEGEVRVNLNRFGLNEAQDKIKLIKGLFEDTLQVKEPIALAHVDCDWHDPVELCIRRLFPYLVPGGIMIFDDYTSFSGCKKAVDSFLRQATEVEIVFQNKSIGVRKVHS